MKAPTPHEGSTFRMEQVEIGTIKLSRTNPRRAATGDAARLADLTESIRNQGVLQPVLVRPLEVHASVDKGEVIKISYELVCGHRRLAAATAAGLEVYDEGFA